MEPADRVRPPALPDRGEIPAAELDDYDFMLTRIRGSEEARLATVAGQPYGSAYFRAMAGSPALAAALSHTGTVTMGVPGRPGTLTEADHEIIDAVLALDSGYTFLLAGHGPLAVRAGVRVEALEALRDGREADLTADERQQVEFVRAVRDGVVTDEIWLRMAARLGSERGVIEYAFFVCLVLFHHLFASSLGVPDLTTDEAERMFEALRSDPDSMPGSYADYVKLYGSDPFDLRA